MRIIGNSAVRSDSFANISRVPTLRGLRKPSFTQPAGFFLRLCAWVFDTTIYGIVQFVLVVLLLLLGSVSLALVGMRLPELTQSGVVYGLSNPSLLLGSVSLLALAMPVVALFMFCAYFAFFESYCSGKTPGKYLVGIQVFDAEDCAPTFGSAFKRNLYKFAHVGIFALGCVLSLALFGTPMFMLMPVILVIAGVLALVSFVLDYLVIFVSPHKQALHDKWSYCYVVIDADYDNSLRRAFVCLSMTILCLWVALYWTGYQEGRDQLVAQMAKASGQQAPIVKYRSISPVKR